jgi:hypothetical protein
MSSASEFAVVPFRVPKRTVSFREKNVWTSGTVTNEAGISTKDFVWVSDNTRVAADYRNTEDSTNSFYVGFVLGATRSIGTAVAFNWAVDAEI